MRANKYTAIKTSSHSGHPEQTLAALKQKEIIAFPWLLHSDQRFTPYSPARINRVRFADLLPLYPTDIAADVQVKTRNFQVLLQLPFFNSLFQDKPRKSVNSSFQNYSESLLRTIFNPLTHSPFHVFSV